MTWSGAPSPLVCCTAPLTPNETYKVGVDDDAGGADLAIVADPAAVGDDPGGAHHATDGRRRTRASCANRSAESSPAPPPTMRRASARSIVRTSGGNTSTTVRVRRHRRHVVGDHEVGDGGRPERLGATYAGLERGDERPLGADLVEFEAATAGDVDHGGSDGGGSGEQWAAERGREPRAPDRGRRVIRATRSRRCRQGRSRSEHQRRRPSRHGERSEFHAADVGGEAGERHRIDAGAGEHDHGRRIRRSSRRHRRAGRLTDRDRARSSVLNVRPTGSPDPHSSASSSPRSRAHRTSSTSAVIDNAAPKATRKATVWSSSNAAPNA